MKNDLPEIVRRLLEAKNICIIGHSSPDGDSLGSVLSLTIALKQLGKQAIPLCMDGVPDKYLFLPEVSHLRKEYPQEAIDILIFLDCSDPTRAGENIEELISRSGQVINIDHHQDNQLFGHLNLHDENAAATGELVYALLQELNIKWELSIAINLYTSIVTDTGSFAYSSTTAHTLRIASFLLEIGVNPAEVSEYAFQMKPYCELKLMGKALDSLHISENGYFAWVSLPIQWFKDTGCSLESMEGIVNFARYIPGVEVGVAFKEVGEKNIKVSLRSSPKVDVSKIAALFGGGGHRQAAGCTIKADLSSAESQVIGAIEAIFQNR